jgi:hypothetical protein
VLLVDEINARNLYIGSPLTLLHVCPHVCHQQSEDGDSMLAKREAAAALALNAVQKRKNAATGEFFTYHICLFLVIGYCPLPHRCAVERFVSPANA